MDSLLSGEETQADAYQLVPLAPKGFGLAIEVVAISLGIISFIVVSLRAYARLGFSVGLGRSWGLDDVLAVIGTVSPSFSISKIAQRKCQCSFVTAMWLTIERLPAYVRGCGRVRRLGHPLRTRRAGP